jgi:hypothetical protein
MAINLVSFNEKSIAVYLAQLTLALLGAMEGKPAIFICPPR